MNSSHLYSPSQIFGGPCMFWLTGFIQPGQQQVCWSMLKSLCQLCVYTIKHTWRQQQTERSQRGRASNMSQKSGLAENLTTSNSRGAEWLAFRSSNHFPVLNELWGRWLQHRAGSLWLCHKLKRLWRLECVVINENSCQIPASWQEAARRVQRFVRRPSCTPKMILPKLRSVQGSWKYWISWYIHFFCDFRYIGVAVAPVAFPVMQKNLGCRRWQKSRLSIASASATTNASAITASPRQEPGTQQNRTPSITELPKIREVFRSPSWLTKFSKVGEDLFKWFIVAGFVWFSVPALQSSLANIEVQKDLICIFWSWIKDFFFADSGYRLFRVAKERTHKKSMVS